jgi:hypothetical protein
MNAKGGVVIDEPGRSVAVPGAFFVRPAGEPALALDQELAGGRDLG